MCLLYTEHILTVVQSTAATSAVHVLILQDSILLDRQALMQQLTGCGTSECYRHRRRQHTAKVVNVTVEQCWAILNQANLKVVWSH